MILEPDCFLFAQLIPNVPVETEVFNGMVEQKKFDCNGFSMSNNGTIGFQITDLTPLSSLTMGMGVGTPDAEEATGCNFFAEDQSVKAQERFSSPGQLAGSYCICVFDVGNIFPGESVGYELEVQHPE